jgi:hypothetical protein
MIGEKLATSIKFSSAPGVKTCQDSVAEEPFRVDAAEACLDCLVGLPVFRSLVDELTLLRAHLRLFGGTLR